MSGLSREQLLRVGVAAAHAIRSNLPLDGFGDMRRLQDYADIWGCAARRAVLDSPEVAELLAAERAAGYEAGAADVEALVTAVVQDSKFYIPSEYETDALVYAEHVLRVLEGGGTE